MASIVRVQHRRVIGKLVGTYKGRQSKKAVPQATENHSGKFRGHPTTADIGFQYTDPEREFMCALDRWKRVFHRPYPSWGEVLGVALGLGYERAQPADAGEFTRAMATYCRDHKRRFPTSSEALAVIVSLGYTKSG